MDHYDKAGAAFELEELAIQRSISQFAGIQMSKTNKASLALNDCEPVRGGEPVAWRLTGRDVETGAPEEIVASVQGIIVKQDLPPFDRKITAGSQSIRYLRQSVTLTGLGTPTFGSAIAEVSRLHTLFIRAVGSKSLDKCTMIGHHDGCNTLEIGNRYFTPIKEAPSAQDIPLSADIDPHGFLTHAKGCDYIHSDDNQVLYLERIGSQDDYKFIPASPILFQVGDIVEVQISIIAVPLREKRFKTMSVLRSLALLDGSFAQRAVAEAQLKLLSAETIPIAPMALKRKVGYEAEVMAETRYKMSKMAINNTDRAQEAEMGDESQIIYPASGANSLD